MGIKLDAMQNSRHTPAQVPRPGRSEVPSVRVLGLTHPKAPEDLEFLGFTTKEDVPVLWSLASAGDPNLALNNLTRLVIKVREANTAEAEELLDAVHKDTTFRFRLFGLLGGSSLLGDHLVANPQCWTELRKPLPTHEDMMSTMLACVDATAVEGAGELVYRAGVTGCEADDAMRAAYRTLLARIAAIDLAATWVDRGEPSGEQASFRQISEALTSAADAALTAALAVATATVFGEDETPGRLGVLAMGKCGANELNYISDVDVIFVAEPADAKATRWAGEFINIGSRVFFEVDAALRPEGKRGALVRTLDSHVAYYNRWAETWEFQAQLKARPMTGDIALAQDYVDALSPKVWAASQRDSFVPDTQAMRRRVVENVPEHLRERELKLGIGGLRDVEFAVQLLQMVHGRTDESLRVTTTVKALQALIDGGYIGREDGSVLIESYEFLRLLEHRLQLQRLKRTHLLPENKDENSWEWLARTSGLVPGPDETFVGRLKKELKRTALEVHKLHSKLFYRPLLESVVSMSDGALRLSKDSATRQLAVLGYQFPERAWQHLSALASGSSRKEKLQAIILPSLMEWLSETVDPDAGLLNYRKLSDVAQDRSWFLRLLRDETVVGQRLMFILGTSPYVATLILNSVDTVKLLSDGATGPKLLAQSPAVVTHSLVAAASRHRGDVEKTISVARSLRRAELARIASADLLGFMDVDEVCRSLSGVWNAVLEAALRAEITAWEDAHVATAPARISVIGMGRLGGSELGYGSDADVMFVCEPVPKQDHSEALAWATTIVESVRTRLGKPTQDPPLDVDLDLRPEGRKGPVVRTIDSYRSYYEKWGETWEFQALLRATWIAGDKDLGIQFLHMIDQFRYPEGGADDKAVREVRRMKARVDSERLPRGADRNTHTKLGRGGLSDVEWTVQLLTMMHSHVAVDLRDTSTLNVLDVLARSELISEQDAGVLRDAWLTATKARNAIVLVKGKRKDQLPKHGYELRAVAAAAKWRPEDSEEFLDDYLKRTRQARQVVDRVFWGQELGFEYGG